MRTRILLPGGGAARTPLEDALIRAEAGTVSRISGSPTMQVDEKKDWRVRISLPPNSKFAFRDATNIDTARDIWEQGSAQTSAGLMADLRGNGLGSDGVVFPYTPQITISHTARYSELALTHSNYKNFFYEGSEVANIQIQGVFTCQNSEEARYLMACIQFLRACTKMNFGIDDPAAGTPPTLVRLSGYGEHYIPGSLNCVVTAVSHAMPDDVDYIKYDLGNSYGWMPIQSTLTVNLQPVVSRSRQSTSTLLSDFVKGSFLGGSTLGTSTTDKDGGIF